MPTNKRELLARAFAVTGFTDILELLPQRPVLLVLTYHRVGNPLDTPYDSGVFSATAEELDAHVSHLKRRFNFVSPTEAIDLICRGGPARATVAITFDDGYLDNYKVAYPILQSHGVSAMFFLATSYVGSNVVPWWDRIAYIVKKSKRSKLRLRYPESREFDINELGILETCRSVLKLYRSAKTTDPDRFERELVQECESVPPSQDSQQLFMNWDQAREMQAGGMEFGSHTHSHTILTTLSPEAQREEFRLSREIMEREMGRAIDVMAYPVGSPHAFSQDSIAGLKATGYRAAFSHYGGFNRSDDIQPFDIRRFPVDRPSRSRLRLQTAIGALTASRWF